MIEVREKKRIGGIFFLFVKILFFSRIHNISSIHPVLLIIIGKTMRRTIYITLNTKLCVSYQGSSLLAKIILIFFNRFRWCYKRKKEREKSYLYQV